MKKFLAVIIAVVVLGGLFFVSAYNGLVSQAEAVDGAFANIETTLQRRADLVPNLVNTVKGYAAHETEAIDAVVSARARLAGARGVEEIADADNELTAALGNLLLVVENYPDLKASANFTQLADELAGTENRIAVARKDYNDAVRAYHIKIRRFPGNLLAGMFGFTEKAYFEADDAAYDVPQVDF